MAKVFVGAGVGVSVEDDLAQGRCRCRRAVVTVWVLAWQRPLPATA
ncbi:MAG: hypothetical protein IPJ94_16745 [Chloroflexi bacterium]|nr:hypothetical protein [Chloroflexota bacterium]